MANKKARQLISYVLPLSNCSGGHRLGVNGLAVDSERSILYSGGRDGSICAWNLGLDLLNTKHDVSAKLADKSPPSTEFRSQVEAHTHWVNDIVLAINNTALVSASSDLTIKVWRPLSDEKELPQTIGQHADYAKCLATASPQSDWVVSGGLDRKICIWDLNGSGKKLEIETKDEERPEKGSIYALAANQQFMASGGPDSIMRLWDPKSGKRITKFVGHTDNIRDILINSSGETIMTASSDQTIKVWSVTACRCMYTLTMHNDSVWSLYSNDSELKTIYSSDRSGLVVKTEFRGPIGEIDDGITLAIAQENDGVNKVITSGNYIWTATSSSCINRWVDVDTNSNIENSNIHSFGFGSLNDKNESPKPETSDLSALVSPNTSNFLITPPDDDGISIDLSWCGARKGSVTLGTSQGLIVPIRALPQETIKGHHGLVKHKLLNDRRRVLSLDTSGDVLLWDLLNCVPIKSFGKQDLDVVGLEVNTIDAVAPWCSIDTRTGRLAVILEENNCFDAEVYADELDLEEIGDFREDQRSECIGLHLRFIAENCLVNLGKWILRYILSNLLEEIIQKDELFRRELLDSKVESSSSSSLATKPYSPFNDSCDSSSGIAVLSPISSNHLPRLPEDTTVSDSPTSHDSGEILGQEKQVVMSSDAEKEAPKEGNSFFGKKFRKGMSFGSRKIRSFSNAEKNVIVDEKVVDGPETCDKENMEQSLDDNFGGVIQRIRLEYKKKILENPKEHLESGITPSQPNETPVLKPPPLTTIIIQEETSGGCVDLYRGTVATTGKDAQIIEERAPLWLGELLLRNKIPPKDPVKVSFILQPWKNLLPSIAAPDGNIRLNANRMLRVKKILAYIAERIESIPEIPNASTMKPEEYLDLYCYDLKLPISMTLATLRTHVWKGGADVLLYYKSR
ncbi:UBP9-binding protein bun107 [Erysiphe neolycopersici]|uniref:UBP9-binding protein bun107 n=1 Tax=Erysiphe neolycopersici TaxID=212602 RepID=A0A420HEK4_9PEZI|nr:UBP9-binding protein bun107 [Erysiphe neolycopersici]